MGVLLALMLAQPGSTPDCAPNWIFPAGIECIWMLPVVGELRVGQGAGRIVGRAEQADVSWECANDADPERFRYFSPQVAPEWRIRCVPGRLLTVEFRRPDVLSVPEFTELLVLYRVPAGWQIARAPLGH